MRGPGMRLVIAAVGRPRDPALSAAITAYQERASRYWPLDVIEVRDEPARGARPAASRDREGTRLLERLAGMPFVVCERDGQRRTSEEFAGWLQDIRESGRDVAFVIGGAFGLAESVTSAAWRRMSLAPWTLPHEIARLVLAEQLYRAGTIVRGEPYHK
jgi:23S rRNA (pseudouridine1915-N3)-methyltransferase